MANPGDRLVIRATWLHTGTANYAVRWRWGYQGMIHRLHKNDDYGLRVANLYHDPSFR